MKTPRRDHSASVLTLACVAVGALAATGVFNSVMYFPLIFAAVCLVLGLAGLWRDRNRRPATLRASLLVAGVLIAVGGWLFNTRAIQERQRVRGEQIYAQLAGLPAPTLPELEPLNLDLRQLEETTSWSNQVTLVTFWAIWCSPCWTEMAELDELYEKHHADGLAVLAVTQYGEPDDETQRQEDRDEAVAFLQRRELALPAAITGSTEVYRNYQAASIPATALIDENGTLVGYGLGLEGGRELMAQATAMLAGSSR